MIKIVAIAGDDGWCIVKDNDKLFIMKPPYSERREAMRDEGLLVKLVPDK